MKIRSFNNVHKAVILLSVLCVLIFGSCKKYLNIQPISGFTPNLIFDNVPDAQGAVNGVYQELTGDYGYGAPLSLYFPHDADDMMGPPSASDGKQVDVSHYNVNAGSTSPAVFTNVFNQLYEGIERANNCIKYIPLMADYNSPSDSAQLHRLYGESLTLRAQYYFDLVKIWGDVPAQFVPASDLPTLFLPKANRDSIYDHILNDLQVAENLVPWYWQINGGQSDGRFTQNAIRGLRARIALFSGGWSLRANGQMGRRSNWLTYYQIAKDECEAIITNGQNILNPSFQAIFQNGLCQGVPEPKEVLFQIGSAFGLGVNGELKLGIYDGPKSSISGYHGSGGVLVLPTYFYLFDSSGMDTRRDVTCAPFTVGATSIAGSNSIVKNYEGKFRRNWATNGATTNPNYLDENWPLIRFSDIYLMDAEADNELNGAPSVNAQKYLGLVRTRAYSGNTSLIGTIPTDHDGFFNAIMKERELEFGGEALRKYDLIRWDSLASRIAETKLILTAMDSVANDINAKYTTGAFWNYTYNGYVLNQLPTTIYWNGVNSAGNINWVTSFYTPTPNNPPPGMPNNWFQTSISSFITYYATGGLPSPPGGFIPNKSELFPFPQTVLSANPALVQNPGY